MGNTKKLITVMVIKFLGFLLIFPLGCDTTDPPSNDSFSILMEDRSCTEIWIKLSITNFQSPTELDILTDNIVAKSINLQSSDTLLCIDSLLPNRTYKLKASSQSISSNEILVTTLDTTSRSFNWQYWTFGEFSAGGSAFYDVTILNENNIFVVGRISRFDSLGNPEIYSYNAIQWDGQKWNYHRVMFDAICLNDSVNGAYPIQAVFSFEDETIITASGLQLAYLKDGIQLKKECIDIPPNKIWGRSSDDFFVVGNHGNILHWDGEQWLKLKTNTSDQINHIYGDYMNENQKAEIICVGSTGSNPSPVRIYNLNPTNNSVSTYSYQNIPFGPTADIWFKPNKRYIIAGNGIYSKRVIGSSELWNKEVEPPINNFPSNAIDGDNFNDIIVCGFNSEILHYNGYNWKNLTDQIGSYIHVPLECKIQNGTVVIVGFNGDQAVVILGKRY